MTSASLTCSACQKGIHVQTARASRFLAMAGVIRAALKAGWIEAGSIWFCSDACKAATAREINPVRPMIEGPMA